MQILVLGMHRSGTSVVSRLLNMMGAYFAPEGVEMAAHHSNPKGFWERKDVYEHCKKLLASIGCDWQRLSQFNINALPAEVITEFKEDATRIILGMDAHRPWFLKEPRMCLLAPLWLELLELPVCVFVYRSPLEVARSLEIRNGFSGTFSFALWEHYTTSALNATLGLRRIQVNHADVMSRPVPTVHALGRQLKAHGVRGLRIPTAEEILAFIDPALYRAREKDASGLGQLSAAQRRLRDACQKGTALLATKPIRFSVTAQAELTRHDKAERVQKESAELERRNTALSTAVAELKGKTELSGAALAKSQKELETVRAQVAVHQRELADKDRLLKTAKEEALKNAATAKEIREALRQEMKLLRDEAKAAATSADILKRDQEIARAKERNLSLEKANAALAQELAKVKAELEGSETASAQLRNKLEAAQKELTVQGKEIAVQQNEIADRNRALEIATARSDEIREIKAKLNASDEEVQAKSRAIADLTNRVRTASARIAVLNRAVEDQLRALKEKDAQIDALAKRSHILKHGLDTIEEYFSKLRASRSFHFMVYTARRLGLVSRTPRRVVEAITSQFSDVRKALKRAKKAESAVAETPLASAAPVAADKSLKPVPRDFQLEPNHVAGAALAKIPQHEGLNAKATEAPRETSPREPVSAQKKQTTVRTTGFRELDTESIDRITDQLTKIVSIVIPVYAGPEDLRRCIDSVLLYTNTPFQLTLIDDCSPDPAIGALLESYKAHSSFRIIRNPVNQGFVRSANTGMRATQRDVVLLNSDTEVTPHWLRKLKMAAYSDAKVATVTPFSNAAGAFSVPEVGVNAPIPFPFTPLKMARLTERLSSCAYPEVPTGNGFCMYIKRAVLEEVGFFDEQNFGRGYGEENDFCMRARKAGWRNVIDDSLFIYHRGNSSFGEEKQALLQMNRPTLDRLHPTYTGLVREFTSSPAINLIRARIGERLAKGASDLHLEKPRLLFILHEGSGGVPMTNADLISKISETHQCFLLTSTGPQMILRAWEDGQAVEKEKWKLEGVWSARNYSDPVVRRIYLQVLAGLGIDLVHIRHLFKHSFDAPFLCKQLGIPVVLSFHDYYFACPSVHLLDQHARFCGGQCTPGLQQCTIPSAMLRDLPMLKEYLPEWRVKVAEMLDCCDAFVTTAESVRKVHLLAYPQLKLEPFWVIEHGRKFEPVESVATAPRPGEPVRILAAGTIEHHKGSGFIRQLKALDKEGLLEFHFLGKTADELRDIGVHHGAYKRDDFPALAREIRPSFAAVLSIWAETYSHTLTEAWSVGLPVLGSMLGAVGERIEKHGGGWIVDTSDPAKALVRIREIVGDRAAYEATVKAVEGIQIRGIEEMADAYRALYGHVMTLRRPTSSVRVGCIIPAGNGSSSFIRVRLPLAQEQTQEQLLAVRLPVRFTESELTHWIDRSELQTLLVQRDVLDKEAARLLLKVCREKRVRVLLEIDDNLLEIDRSHEEFDAYTGKTEAVRYLARSADHIIISTEELLKAFRPLNQNIHVIGNALDEWLWFSPSSVPVRSPSPNTIVAGYMGTLTHRADLEMIREPFLRARERLKRDHGIRLVLELVGVEDQTLAEDWYQRLKVPRGHTSYPRFVRWWRRTIAWDIGVAPLVANQLNKAKSALKFMEYSAVGLPAIFSPVGEYAHLVKHRETGLLASANQPEEWENLIVELAASPTLRTLLAANAQREIREHHLLSHRVSVWKRLLQPSEGRAPFLRIAPQGSSMGGEASPLPVSRGIRRALQPATPSAAEPGNDPVGKMFRAHLGDQVVSGNGHQQQEPTTLLFILHDGGGGTILTSGDLAANLPSRFRCLLLKTGLKAWNLFEFIGGIMVPIQRYVFAAAWQANTGLDRERREVLASLFHHYTVSLVHFRHLLANGPEAIRLVKEFGARIVFSFHDFYTICPTIQLIDGDGRYCGGPCTKGERDCELPIGWFRKNLGRLRDGYVHTHRAQMAAALAECDWFITTSASAREVILRNMPEIPSERFSIIEHGRAVILSDLSAAATAGLPAKVVCFGALNASKGVALMAELLKLNLAAGSPFQFHFIGNIVGSFKPRILGGVVHGPYDREKLPNILASIRPSYSVVASLWPETYCHTLTESWTHGIPVFASDIGTIRERVLRHGGGWLLDPYDAPRWFAEMQRVLGLPGEYAARKAEALAYRPRSIEEMAADYCEIYHRVLQLAELSRA
jgi:GT2 family glycosyltransferase/glycosyltransferase involved in cell wall biosynthesis